MKLKVGDRVRILTIKELYDKYGAPKGDTNDLFYTIGPHFAERMWDYTGEIAKITYIHRNGQFVVDIDNNYYTWSLDFCTPYGNTKYNTKIKKVTF